MNKKTTQLVAASQELSILALTFLAGDTTALSRFLDVTGWTPQTLSDPGSRDAILVAVLDHLMREEDLLLTSAANAGIDPTEIPKAFHILSRKDDDPSWT